MDIEALSELAGNLGDAQQTVKSALLDRFA
jgi:hypothetical protein